MRRLTSWLRLSGLAVAIGLLASSACNDGDSRVTRSAGGAGRQAAGSGGSSAGSGEVIVISGGTGGSTSSAGAPSLESIVAPLVLCGSGEGGAAGQGDAGAAGAPHHDDTCAPPPSQCADMNTLVYFTDGSCVNGKCQWSKETRWCQDFCTA